MIEPDWMGVGGGVFVAACVGMYVWELYTNNRLRAQLRRALADPMVAKIDRELAEHTRRAANEAVEEAERRHAAADECLRLTKQAQDLVRQMLDVADECLRLTKQAQDLVRQMLAEASAAKSPSQPAHEDAAAPESTGQRRWT
jgi:uncharacterized membrane protein YccC